MKTKRTNRRNHALNFFLVPKLQLGHAMVFEALLHWALAPGERFALASSPDAPVQTTQTTAASTTFNGLTPGTAYSVEVNVVGSAGPSDWTCPVSQIAI